MDSGLSKAVSAKKPILIGIAGPSCSGKTLLAKSLSERLKPDNTSILTLDSYYYDLADLPFDSRKQRNFDIPDALDWNLLESHIELLAEGNQVEKPVYLFPSHTRSGKGELMVPGEYVIIEGLFALNSELIRSFLGMAVYIALDDTTCLDRRIERDMAERGRSRESIIDQFESTVKPMAKKYVYTVKHHADIIINGADSIEESTVKVINTLRTI